MPAQAQDALGGILPPLLEPAAVQPAEPRRCPPCAVALERKQAGPVQIDVCHQCRGLFLEEGRLNALYELRAARRLDQGVAQGLSNRVAKEGAGWGLFETLMEWLKKWVE
jgi:hypothetical protein